MKINTPGPENPSDQLASLRDILQRIAQAERPADFSFIKQVVIARIAELEEDAALTSMASCALDLQ